MNYKIFIFIFLFLFFGTSNAFAGDARVYLLPQSGEVRVGQSLGVRIFIDAPLVPMNAASVSVKVPTDLFRVISVAKNNSIIDVWPTEPSVSRESGIVSFEGVVLNPGFQGTKGLLATIYIEPKIVGQGTMILSEGKILANDGLGTELSTALEGTTLIIKEKLLPKEPEKKDKNEGLQCPEQRGATSTCPSVMSKSGTRAVILLFLGELVFLLIIGGFMRFFGYRLKIIKKKNR